MKNGKPIYLYEHGLPERDFVYIDDVVQANLLALQTDSPPGCCINIGEGSISTINDIAMAMGRATHTTPFIKDRGEFRVGDIRSCYADLQQAHKILGYQPKVGLKKGMQRYTNWADTQEPVDLYQKTVDELQRHNLFGRSA